MATNSSVEQEDNMSDYDLYSRTPPRTKILRKNRQRKQKSKEHSATSSPKIVKAHSLSLCRRNTVSTNMFEDLVAKADTSNDSDQGPMKRSNKRHIELLRKSERDLKLDIASAQAASELNFQQKTMEPSTPQPSYQIESCKRFMSLSCRTFPCSKQNSQDSNNKGSTEKDDTDNKKAVGECPQSRVQFYETFSKLVRMGCGDKALQERLHRRTISREESLWQNELKDLIWLELQAFHADRTPVEQDTYLCLARQHVDPLLNDIMTYRFERHDSNNKPYLTQNSSDSGVEDDCTGCLSIYCHSCIDAQNEAIKDIEELMRRLECAESLFPSSHAFAELHPLYSSPEFVGRVKAISLWYNMTKNQRLKLLILGRLMCCLETKGLQQFPMREEDSTSPSDSNSSSASSNNDFFHEAKICCANFHNFIAMLPDRTTLRTNSPYRKYIENILKTRTLHKSLGFLDKLHYYVLRKVQLTLEKPQDETVFDKNVCDTEEEELQRYGCWSPEAKVLGLPSYRSSFLFLAFIPLEIIHEFLKMRLEQKPEKPSPLSIRQLMRELREGLKVATAQKKTIVKYAESAVTGTKESLDSFHDKLKDYDECMLKVFVDYLEYLKEWALLHHQSFQKNLLEEEWEFSLQVIECIPGGSEALGRKFCFILCSILKSVAERLKDRIEEVLDNNIPKDDSNMIKQTIFSVCREMQSVFNEEREMSIKTIAFCKTVFKHELPADSRDELTDAIISLKCSLPEVMSRVHHAFDQINLDIFDEIEKGSLISRIREILMQGYRFGFEFYKEMNESITADHRGKLTRSILSFANLWMKFVTERCERGRGMRPRWAYQGLDFLLTVCEPRNTVHLTEEEFAEFEHNMDVCISHVIGIGIGPSLPPTPDSGFFSPSTRTSRSRGSSPSPRPTYKSQRSGSRRTSREQGSPVVIDSLDSMSLNSRKDDPIVKIKLPTYNHSERCLEAIEQLEAQLNERLKKQNLIGKVINCENVGYHHSKSHIRRKYVTFTWQRGIKIGQGRFGKVYTAVNNNTGEMMAVKEIALQPGDTLTIKRVAEEIKILEGIVHPNLVRYYGVEVHKEEMLIFMEFCEEGTLESLIAASENGLSELLLRRYTFQLVLGVAVLHEHGIVHRDIKTANIFLTDGGNCLKIGDFGSAAKIKSHSTMPGELQGYVGTQAYMAPEVFTKNMSEGHGRAADIWSVGCVVVEMASGKRPWCQYDSNYQIMFKVGMGQSPDPPDNMTDEGLDFLQMCFQHNPKDRATAQELLEHTFVKLGEDII